MTKYTVTLQDRGNFKTIATIETKRDGKFLLSIGTDSRGSYGSSLYSPARWYFEKSYIRLSSCEKAIKKYCHTRGIKKAS